MISLRRVLCNGSESGSISFCPFSTQADDEEERQKNELHKLLASEQRSAISQLYLDRNRPSFDNGVSSNLYLSFTEKAPLSTFLNYYIQSRVYGGKKEAAQLRLSDAVF